MSSWHTKSAQPRTAAWTLGFAVVALMPMGPSGLQAEDFISRTLAEKKVRPRLPEISTSSTIHAHNRARLLVLERSRTELAPTAEQSVKIDRLLADWCEQESANNRIVSDLMSGEMTPADRERMISASAAGERISNQFLEGLAGILTAEQAERLNQLVIQTVGFFAVRNPFDPLHLVDKLNLDEAQLAQIRKLRMGGKDGKPTRHEQFLQLLTPEQRRQWELLNGKTFFPPPSDTGGGRIRSDIPFLRSPLSLLEQEPVRRALALTEEQQRPMADAIVAWLNVDQRWKEQLIAGADEEAEKQELAQLRSAVEHATKVLESGITESQMNRLKQLALQKAGLSSFLWNYELGKQLNLSQEQRQKIEALVDPTEPIGDIRTRKEQMRRAYLEALEILTEEQRETWRQLTGEPVSFEE